MKSGSAIVAAISSKARIRPRSARIAILAHILDRSVRIAGPCVRNFVKTDPLMIDANESVLKAAQMMRDKGTGNILILIKGEPKGILTERDILNSIAADDLLSSSIPVRKIMTSPMISIEADEPLSDGVQLMAKHKIRTVFVTDHGKPLGLLNMRAIVGDQFKVAKSLES